MVVYKTFKFKWMSIFFFVKYGNPSPNIMELIYFSSKLSYVYYIYNIYKLYI